MDGDDCVVGVEVWVEHGVASCSHKFEEVFHPRRVTFADEFGTFWGLFVEM